MARVLIVYQDANGVMNLKESLMASGRVELVEATTSDQAFQAVKDTIPELVIVYHQLAGMTGLDFINKLVQVNPLVNTALVSELSGDEFHEATEGLGVMMPLPMNPSDVEVGELLAKMEKIASLMQPLSREESK